MKERERGEAGTSAWGLELRGVMKSEHHVMNRTLTAKREWEKEREDKRIISYCERKTVLG